MPTSPPNAAAADDRTLDALRDRVAELQDAQRLAHVGSWSWDATTDATTGSAECFRLYGLDQATQPFPAFRDQAGWLYPRDVWQLLETAAHEALATGVGYALDVEAFRNGAPIWLNIRSEVVRDAAGRSVGLRGTVQDITARKAAESALGRQQAAFRALADHAPDSVDRLDREARHLYINAAGAKLLGLSPAQLLGKTSRECGLPDPWAGGWEALIDRVFMTGEPLETEGSFPTADGLRFFQTRCVPERAADGSVASVLTVSRETTTRRQVEEALRDAKAALERRVEERTAELLAANATLAQQAAQLQTLSADRALAEERERQRLGQVLHDGLQQFLVAARLRVNRMQSGDPAGVPDGCREVLGLLKDATTASRSLSAELSPPLLHTAGFGPALEWLAHWMAETHHLTVTLTGDRQVQIASDTTRVLLFHSIRELLFNVVKHAGVSEATVDVNRTEGQLQITVADRGASFDPNQTQPLGRGGLGLPSIRQRLEYLGGTLAIASATGQGSRCTLTVPLPPPV
jgi:PAS domain S-box-containing protein